MSEKEIMKKLLYIVTMIAVITAVSVQDIYAGGGRRNGTAGAQELLIPVGARGLAMSTGFISGIGGIEAIYFNPAGLVNSTNSVEVYVSQMSFIADIGISYAAIATNFGDLGSFGFSIKSLNLGDIPVTTVENPQGDGSTYSPNYVTATLTYSNRLTDRIRVGANFKLVSEKIVRTSATGFSLDAGVQYAEFVGIEGLNLGVVLKNFGPQMKFDGADLLRPATEQNALRGINFYKIDAAGFDLPSQLEIGLAYEPKIADDMGLLLTTTYQDNNFQDDEYKLGAEFSYDNMFFIRGGFTFFQTTGFTFDWKGEGSNTYGPTFGAGFLYDTGVRIAVDYAYRSAQFFDGNHLFSIKFGF
jgi:hypothetical protein